ncbi:MAG: hypothetical protein ABIM74_06075 [candidate division WOR-3 bacterium]
MFSVFITINISQTLFAKAYGEEGVERLHSICQTQDGGYILSGRSNSFSSGDDDVFILKIDKVGNLIWARTYGGPDADIGNIGTLTEDGGYLLLGETRSFGQGENDVLILKVNQNGDVEWAETFGSPGYDAGISVIQAHDGGYVITGYTGFGAGAVDLLALKIGPDGAFHWARSFGGPGFDLGVLIIRTEDGYAISGSEWGSGLLGGWNAYVLRLDVAGNPLWARLYGSGSDEQAQGIAQAPDGGFVFAGYTSVLGPQDYLVMKLSPAGDPMWAKAFGGESDDQAYPIIRASDGGFVVAGYACSFEGMDFLILKLKESGDLEWARGFGGYWEEAAYNMIQTQDAGLAIVGFTVSYGAGNEEAAVLKIDPQGNYPECVVERTPNETPIMPLFVDYPNMTVIDEPVYPVDITSIQLNPRVTEICPTVGGNEAHSDWERGVLCRSVPGGLVFTAMSEATLKIYSPDGRLESTAELKRGQNKVLLRPGIHFWHSGPYKGKAVVR